MANARPHTYTDTPTEDPMATIDTKLAADQPVTLADPDFWSGGPTASGGDAALELLVELAAAGVTIEKAPGGGWRIVYAADCSLSPEQRSALHAALKAALPTLVDDIE